MFCEKCGKDNPEGMKFCETCGAPLETEEVVEEVAEEVAAEVEAEETVAAEVEAETEAEVEETVQEPSETYEEAAAPAEDNKQRIIKIAVAIIAIKSDRGATNRMVSTFAKKVGNTKMKGVKHTTSRTRDAMIAKIGLPAAWKKMECILIKQLTTIKDRKMRRVFTPNSQ